MGNAIRIREDFSESPGGRYRIHGPDSGEAFREDLLAPALRQAQQKGDVVVVVLDGTAGYASSFLDEAFAGLVRARGFSAADLGRILKIVANDPLYLPYKNLAEQYISEALSRRNS